MRVRQRDVQERTPKRRSQQGLQVSTGIQIGVLSKKRIPTGGPVILLYPI